jgi:hypothetical protein
MKAHRVVRLSSSAVGCPLPPGRFLVLISVRGWVDPRDTVWLEGLGPLKIPMTSLRIEPVTFRLVAKCLNQLRYLVPHPYAITKVKEQSPKLWSLAIKIYIYTFQREMTKLRQFSEQCLKYKMTDIYYHRQQKYLRERSLITTLPWGIQFNCTVNLPHSWLHHSLYN